MNLKDEILHLTRRGLDVFYFYMPIDFVPKRNFRNPFYEDKRASCNIYLDTKTDTYRMKDFGDESFSGDCFWLVSIVKNLSLKTDFRQIMAEIIRDLSLPISMSVFPISISTAINCSPKTGSSVRYSQTKHIENNSKPYKVKRRVFDRRDEEYWGRYGIGLETLEKFNVACIDEFNSISNQGNPYAIYYKNDEPIYGYMFQNFVKIYRPFSDIRFLYGGEKDSEYVFGIDQLPNRGDMVLVTGGEKDVLSLAAHGYFAICFNSETAHVSEALFEMLHRRFKHIVILYDMDDTGIRASQELEAKFPDFNLLRIELPLNGSKEEKDISDFFMKGYSSVDLKKIISKKIASLYNQTILLLSSFEIDYSNPPDMSKAIVSINRTPIGTQDNLLCITGGEGTGKSNFVSAIVSGTLVDVPISEEMILGLSVAPNPKSMAVLHYDTEQSEAQLYKNVSKSLKRAQLIESPSFFHTVYLAPLSRKERLKLIRESMDLYYHMHEGIHVVVIDGIADLIRSANDEAESISIVDELYRLAGIYNTCIVCVLHFVPNGVKLRGHIGSELQRKAAGILSIEKEDNSEFSVLKTLKVRDGSALDVPMILFGWDKELGMLAYRGEKSKEEKEKRKYQELISVTRTIYHDFTKLSYTHLCERIMDEMSVGNRTAKKYIAYLKEVNVIDQDTLGNYIISKNICRT